MGTSSSSIIDCTCQPDEQCSGADKTGCEQLGCTWTEGASSCTGEAGVCGNILAGQCAVHGCQEPTTCVGTHPPCSFYQELQASACQQHGCMLSTGSCTGMHDCSVIAPSECSAHGCSTQVSCMGDPTPCSQRTVQECEQARDGCRAFNGGCGGTPILCAGRAMYACNTGCTWTSACTNGIVIGVMHTCTDHSNDAFACASTGCTWNPPSCSGAPHACSAHMPPSCPASPSAGCSAPTACTGTTADMCEAHFSSTTCAEHPNCSWATTAGECVAPLPDACNAASDVRTCAAGCVCR